MQSTLSNFTQTPAAKSGGFEAKILLDSVSPAGSRLTTMEITYPRFVHAEFMTHRVFSRNSASSRAIPIEKMLEKVKTLPAMPIEWGANQSGMQAKTLLTGGDLEAAQEFWLTARDNAVAQVEAYLGREQSAMGGKVAHKQIVNRILEPFLWHTVIVTGTQWSNFFALRCDEQAQPEIHMIADMMKDIYSISTPVKLRDGQWHMPLIQEDERETTPESDLRKISVARCARVSYLTHDGKRDYDADLRLFNRLQASMHMSPFEHVARPWMRGDNEAHRSNFTGWVQYRKLIPGECR